jgi:RNA-directed DNA polymerase
LLFRQQSRCGTCGRYFRDEDRLEIDHILPRQLGGTDELSNLWVLHRHCHDQRHAASQAGGLPVKNATTEELDEEKILTSSFEGRRGGAILLA